MKVCKKCNISKPIYEFTSSRSTKDKLRNWCKTCFSVYDKARRCNLSDEYKKGRSLVRYWPELTPIGARRRYLSILESQNGVCKICKNPPTAINKFGRVREFNVDHCHFTGKVRGLLCESCNLGIGLLGDSTLLLKQAIIYLEQA